VPETGIGQCDTGASGSGCATSPGWCPHTGASPPGGSPPGGSPWLGRPGAGRKPTVRHSRHTGHRQARHRRPPGPGRCNIHPVITGSLLHRPGRTCRTTLWLVWRWQSFVSAVTVVTTCRTLAAASVISHRAGGVFPESGGVFPELGISEILSEFKLAGQMGLVWLALPAWCSGQAVLLAPLVNAAGFAFGCVAPAGVGGDRVLQ
jgi:hypothetical protein